MGVLQRTAYDPVAIKFAFQEERVRRRLAVPSTRSAMWERSTRKAANQWSYTKDMEGYHEPELVTNAVLTASQVREIKRIFTEGAPRGTTAKLARKYLVNYKTIRDIRQGITWTRLV